MRREYKYSAWPQFYEREPRNRVLCYIENGKIITENGEEYEPKDYEDFKRYLVENSCDCYVSDLRSVAGFAGSASFLTLALKYSDEVHMSSRGKIVGITLKRGRNKRFLGPANNWAGEYNPSRAFLQRMRAFFDYVGVGTYASEAATGQAMQRSILSQYKRPRFPRPTAWCRADILDGMTGARVDTIVEENILFDYLYEIDLTNAYASMSRWLPNGHEIAIPRPDNGIFDLNFATFYAQATVTVTSDVKFGPLHVRQENDLLHYPSSAGEVFSGWFWKEELEEAVRIGWRVEINGKRAWGWRSMTLVLLPWANKVDELRRTAPEQHIKQKVKQMIVASLGRQGMQPYKFKMIPIREATKEDVPMWGGEEADTVGAMRKVYEPNAYHMNHWYSYIIMRCRNVLYRRMLEEEESGNNVVASNYDAIYLTQPTLLAVNGEMGGWKQDELTNVRIPAPRWIDSDQKVRHPGEPRRTDHATESAL